MGWGCCLATAAYQINIGKEELFLIIYLIFLNILQAEKNMRTDPMCGSGRGGGKVMPKKPKYNPQKQVVENTNKKSNEPYNVVRWKFVMWSRDERTN